MSPEDSVDVLLGWCDALGIIIDERIRVVRGDEGDIAVFSATDAVIERGTTLVTIPKSCILSIKSCALSDFITPVTYGREAQLGLAIGVYGELLKGNSSLWAGYAYSLPEAVDLAYFWSDEDGDEDARSACGWIKGTMAERELQGRCVSSRSYAKSSKCMNDLSIVDDFRRYYDTVAKSSLMRAGLGHLATFQGYKHAFALVSSRAFFVDAYHGLAMVPIADAFNHHLENQVHLESDFDVCPACGSLEECLHDTEDDNNAEDGGNLSLQLRTRRLDPAGGAPQVSQVDTQNTCEMVTNVPIVPFAEIWNTYGETLTNAELLVRFGFLLDSNENDVIVWDPRDLRDFSSGVLGEEQRTRNSGTTSCEEGIDMSDNDCDAHVRRGLSLQYQSLDDVGGKRDQIIREAHRSPKTGSNDDHHLLGVPGSSTSRPHLATFTNSGGSESSLLNTDLSAAQNLLNHLDDLIFLWHCGSSDIWRSSNLVYDPFSRDGDEKHDAAHCVHRRRRRGEEAEDLVSMKAVPVVATSADLLTPSGLRGEEVSKLKALDGAPALDAHSTIEKQAHIFRQQYEDPKCLFALNDEAKISHHLWLFCVLLAVDRFTESPETINRESRTATGGTATLRCSNSIGRDRSVAIGAIYDSAPEAQCSREVAASEESGSSSLLAAVSAQNLQSLVMRCSDSQLLANLESKSRHVDLAFLKRVARAQVQLEELCEAHVLEEEKGEDDCDPAETSSGKSERRRPAPECFSERSVGSVEAEAEAPVNDGTRVCSAKRLQFELMAEDDSRHTRSTHDARKDTNVSAINAIKSYGDSEDDEDEEMGQLEVAVEKFESANDKSTFAAGTGICTIAHEHQGRRRRDDSHDEGRPTIGIFAGNRSSDTDEDEWSNSSSSRVRKRRRRVSPVCSSNTLQLANDGIAGAAVSDESTEICMENESSPSAFGRLIPHDAGREDNVHVPRYERSEESDPVTDADGVHSINLRNAREDLAPPPSASRLRLHSPCLDLGKGEDGGGRARGLASSAPSGRDYGHVGVEASDIGGGEGSNERNECRVQFNAWPRLGAENSVSDMGSGNRARILPVAFGVRLGSDLDVDAGGHDESDDDQHHARKPEANPSARFAIPPNQVGAEMSEDATCVPAGVSGDIQLNYVDKQLPGNVGDPSPVDSLAVVEIVASIAQVVTALCNHRLRSMCKPGMEARELGELADGIPPESNKSRLAAQLALAERSLLESWGTAWADFGRKLESLRVTQAEHDPRR